jgi:hypothetical protein
MTLRTYGLFNDPESVHSEEMLSLLEKYSS